MIESGGRPDLVARLDAIHADFVARMIRFYQTDPSVHEIAGASDTFRRLHAAGIKVALDTGFSRDIVDVILDRLGWNDRPLVDTTVTSDEVPRGRPHPDMIAKAMRDLGITDPRRVAKVGDTPSDLQEGTGAGCGLVIGVTARLAHRRPTRTIRAHASDRHRGRVAEAAGNLAVRKRYVRRDRRYVVARCGIRRLEFARRSARAFSPG